MKTRVFLMVVGLMLVLFCYSSAQVPQMINYQGKLTKASGAVMDTTIQMVFTIYADSGGVTALWTETQAGVKVEKGVFNVLLGSVNPIDYSVFDGTTRYLGVQVGGDPEITPRKAMVSVAYAIRAGGSQVDCHDCDTVFVNVAGPDSVVTTTGTAFRGAAYGSVDDLIGVRGHVQHSGSDGAYGGFFSAYPGGTGERYGLYAEGRSDSPSPAYGAYNYAAHAEPTSPGHTYGTYSKAANASNDEAYGGYFTTTSHGSGNHYGLYALGASNSSSAATGTYSEAENTSSGDAYGGYFLTATTGSGRHYGVYGVGSGSSSDPVYGSFGFALNSSSGNAYGGYFIDLSSGTGTHYGVYGVEVAGGGGAAVYASGDFAGTGAKYAVVKTGKGHRLLSCMESPEIWFEDFGEGRLVNGKAHIELDALFLETVTINADHPMKVFVQLEGDCNGVFVSKGTTGFDVSELKSGTSNIIFSYRVVAKRKGYETERMRETDIGYDDPTLYPELQAELYKAYQEEKQQQQLQREKRRQEAEQRRAEQIKMEEDRTRMEK